MQILHDSIISLERISDKRKLAVSSNMRYVRVIKPHNTEAASQEWNFS